jgi:hypothetical protein
MKNATIPSLRVAAELRSAAEDVLLPGETLSGFVEQSLREGIHRRGLRNEFIARGLAAREEAQKTGFYFTADDVLSTLDDMLKEAAMRTAS